MMPGLKRQNYKWDILNVIMVLHTDQQTGVKFSVQ